MEEVKYVRKKSSGLATLLSFFWCGLGQIYNGQIFKGIILMILYAVCWALAGSLGLFGVLGLSSLFTGEGLEPDATATVIIAIVFGIAVFVLWIYGMVNPHKTAERINKGEF